MAYLPHVQVRLNGRLDVYAENFSLNESSEHVVKRYPGGAFVIEKSTLAPQATVSFDVGVMPSTTGQANYRELLRRGTEVTLQWVGADKRIHVLQGIVTEANETDPPGTGHQLSVTAMGVVTFPV